MLLARPGDTPKRARHSGSALGGNSNAGTDAPLGPFSSDLQLEIRKGLGMNILFLGGTGNISTDCGALLQARGHRIIVLTRGRNPVPAGYTAIVADRHDVKAVSQALRDLQVDVVVNFIGFNVPDVAADFELFAGRVRQYIFISTTVVCAKPHAKLPLTETSPVGNPFSPYGQGKLACEEWLLSRCREGKFPVTSVRPSHTYSCRWIPNPVASSDYTVAARLEQGKPIFVHDDGQGLWTLTASSDFAVGLAGLAGRDDAIGEIFQITGDMVLTWNQICAEIARALGVAKPKIVHIPTDFICAAAPVMIAKLKGDKAEHGVFDNAKIKRFVPDFDCRKSFRQGIAEAVAWFRADSARQTVNPEIDAIFEHVLAKWEKVD